MAKDAKLKTVVKELEDVLPQLKSLKIIFTKLDIFSSTPPDLKEITPILLEIRKSCSIHKLENLGSSFGKLENILKSVEAGGESHFTGLSYALNIFEVIETALDSEEGLEKGFSEQEFELVNGIYQMFVSEKEEKRVLSEKERATVDKVFKEVTFFDFGTTDAENRVIIEDFIQEALDPMEEIEDKLLSAEDDPKNLDIDSIFRHLHSIKGTASFLGLNSIQHISHAGENLLDHVRSNPDILSQTIIRTTLRVVDMIRLLFSNLSMKLEQSKDKKPRFPAVIQLEPLLKGIENLIEGKSIQDLDLDSVKKNFVSDQSAAQASTQENKEDSIRISTTKMEELYSMIGELTVLMNAIKEDPTIHNAHFSTRNKIENLIRVTDNLRTKVADTHMLPMVGIFKRLQRLVMDLAKKKNKKVAFETVGEQIEIHKNTFETLSNFLIHMIRNSVDHGIELPDDRIRVGKALSGLIKVSIKLTSDKIILMISDDGKGLDKEKILKKATEKGLLAPDAELTDQEIFEQIFQPGFSTADEISDVSGRGVGMDVVKTAIIKMGGRIIIESEKGKGTCFMIHLPIMTSTSIIDGLVARIGKTFAIFPIFTVEHTFSVLKGDIKRAKDENDEFVIYRDQAMPIVKLGKVFNIPVDEIDITKKVIFVVREQDKPYGLLADELLSQQQVVVESLKDHLDGLIGISGGAILGNGRFGLIMDTKSIVNAWKNQN